MSALDEVRPKNILKERRYKLLYWAWYHLRSRCNNPADKEYRRYGGRGIRVCPEWDHFWTFVFDMGFKPSPKHSLDRINNDGDYGPSNCRWATAEEQQQNTSRVIFIEFNGERHCLRAWARKIGISAFGLRNRLKKWPLEKALTTPPFAKRALLGVVK